MNIQIKRKKYGLEVILTNLEVIIDVPADEVKNLPISIPHVSREFHSEEKLEDTDDISYIDIPNGLINLTEILEQEILIKSF